MTARIALFDIDNTLTDKTQAFSLWAEEVAANHPQIEPTWLHVANRPSITRVEFFTLLRARYGLERSVARLHADYRRRTAELVPHRPEVIAALTDLKDAGWALGAVTNGERTTQMTKLRTAQLDHLLGTVIAAGDYGIRKPEAALMHMAVEDLHAAPDAEVWMVGDDLATDVVGAHTAGLGSIWISHGRMLAPHDPQPKVICETVVEAARWLATAGTKGSMPHAQRVPDGTDERCLNAPGTAPDFLGADVTGVTECGR
ncbi:HAD family hydrolase [Streptomyces albidoflavus]